MYATYTMYITIVRSHGVRTYMYMELHVIPKYILIKAFDLRGREREG